MKRLTTLAAAAGFALLPCLGARSEEAAAQAVKVADGKKISIEYTLALDDGKQADSNVGEPPLVYEHGADQLSPPALERALAGLAVGETKRIKISPKDGFGDVDPTREKQVSIDEIPEEARKVDAVLVGVDAQGNQMPVRVKKVDAEKVTLDLNHPLAGRTLTFDVKILKIE